MVKTTKIDITIASPKDRISMSKLSRRIHKYIINSIFWPRLWVLREVDSKWYPTGWRNNRRQSYRGYGYRPYDQISTTDIKLGDLDKIIGYMSRRSWVSYILPQYLHMVRKTDKGKKVSAKTYKKHLKNDLTQVSIVIKIDDVECQHMEV